MFGFVTFVYPETVKLILAKGNPHFVCDSRVLVKPYKEKGKVPEKYVGCLDFVDFKHSKIVRPCFVRLGVFMITICRKQHQQQQQHLDRGEFSGCLSPSALDSREPYELPFGKQYRHNAFSRGLRFFFSSHFSNFAIFRS